MYCTGRIGSSEPSTFTGVSRVIVPAFKSVNVSSRNKFAASISTFFPSAFFTSAIVVFLSLCALWLPHERRPRKHSPEQGDGVGGKHGIAGHECKPFDACL